MKAAYLNSRADSESFIIGDIPTPRIGPREVLVAVHAAAITPTELQWKPTFTTSTGEPRPFPVVLGHEFSGVITSVGTDTGGLHGGDVVCGLNDWFSNGAQAEYCVAPASALAPKPQTIDHVHAAAVPISALTAWQALVIRAGLRDGQSVLVHGAAGGVGLFAVQLAHARGAHVIATASAANREFVRELGADEVIDYRMTPFENVARNVDVVLDTVGGDTLDRSWAVLKPGGTLVTIAASSERMSDPRVCDAFMLVAADGAQLGEISRLIDVGQLRVSIAGEFPLDRGRDAYASAKRGGGRGKTVICVAA